MTSQLNSKHHSNNGETHIGDNKKASLTIDVRQLILIVLATVALSFSLGAFTEYLNNIPGLATMVINTSNNQVSNVSEDKASGSGTPRLSRDDDISSANLNELHVNFEQPGYEDLGKGEGATQYPTDKRYSATSPTPNDVKTGGGGGRGDEGDQHLPAGQHLLVDIKNVNADFLNSESRLTKAMVKTIDAAGLTLLSYHCHSLIPAGVSCVGVLLESHMSFHTWPEEGVITLDLFTCGNSPLLPVVSIIETLFGLPRTTSYTTDEDEEDDYYEDDDDEDDGDTDNDIEGTIISWSHELRGFRHNEPYVSATKTNYLDSNSDLAIFIMSPLDLKVKKEIIVTTSEHYRIDIWEILGHDDIPSYVDGMKHNLVKGDPRWMTADIVEPTRILFMNGALQCMTSHEREFHESLVHPTMFAHSNPVHVAVIGGGEGAAIREVLKHNTVQTVTMIEMDSQIVEIAREFLPSLSDCSDIVGAADNCFDDSRVNLIREDAKTWFLDRFGSNSNKVVDNYFDVILLDTLEPQDNLDLYHNEQFLNALMNSLSTEGTIGVHLGDSHTIHDPKADKSNSTKERNRFMVALENHEETGTMFVYDEAHTGFEIPSSFLTVCKSTKKCMENWFAEAQATDYQISARILETNSKKPNLINFDGATQLLYQIPPRAWEEVYCRREPKPFECDFRSLDPTKTLFEVDIKNEDDSDFQIELMEDDHGDQISSVYAKKDIPKGSYIMATELASSFTIGRNAHDALKSNVQFQQNANVIKDFLKYIDDSGHESLSEGRSLTYVEIGASALIRKSSDTKEANIGRWMPNKSRPVYSPVYDRHTTSLDVFLVATRDIKEGEEIVKPENLW